MEFLMKGSSIVSYTNYISDLSIQMLRRSKRKRHPGFRPFACALMTTWLVAALAFNSVKVVSAAPSQEQSQVISVGILSFEDQSAESASPGLAHRIKQQLRQRINSTYKDLLVRDLAVTADASAIKAMTVEQIAALGKQSGVSFVIRGGVLGVSNETSGDGSKTAIQLYADVISVGSASMSSLRAEGSGVGSGGSSSAASKSSTIDFSSDKFQSSPLGQAVRGSIEQLTASVYQAIRAASSEVASLTPQPQASTTVTEEAMQTASNESDDAAAAEADEELQQLIAQAESLLSNNSAASTASLDLLRQALEGLKAALGAKAALMEQAKDTTEADQKIAARKRELQAALSAITEGVSAATPVTNAEEPSGEKKNKLAVINEYFAEAVSILQKIQEIRAMFSSAKQEPPYESSTPGETTGEAPTGEQTAPVEEPLGEVGGVVTEDGNPVKDGTVTDAESGATAPTNSDGTFTLSNVMAGRLLKLIVTRAGKQVAMGKIFVPRGRFAVADFDLKQKPGGAISGALKVIPPTVVVNANNTRNGEVGVLRGVVLNADGKPVPRALVHLKGLAMARTDSQGRYAFLNVPQGVYQLTVKHSELRSRVEQVQVAAKKTNESKTQFTPGDRTPRQPVKQSLIVREAGAILRGRVLDKNDRPMGGARVTLIQGSGAMFVYSGSTGAYEFKSLKPGPYRVVISRLGFESLAHPLTLPAGGVQQRDFNLAVKSSPLIERVLDARRAGRLEAANQSNRIKPQIRQIAPKRGRLNGSIFDAQSRGPISGATVSLQGLQSIKSDREGKYTLADLSPGSYQLQVGIEGYRWQKKTVLIREGISAREDFLLVREDGGRDAENLRRLAVKSGLLRGQITDARTGKPIPGASVSIEGRGSAVTTSDGLYTLTNLPPGNYSVSIKKTGYSDVKGAVMTRAGAAVPANFKLKPKTSSLTGPGVLRVPR
jgi:hypothetical protein